MLKATAPVLDSLSALSAVVQPCRLITLSSVQSCEWSSFPQEFFFKSSKTQDGWSSHTVSSKTEIWGIIMCRHLCTTAGKGPVRGALTSNQKEVSGILFLEAKAISVY